MNGSLPSEVVDSADLADAEVERAIPTSGEQELATLLRGELSPGRTLGRREIRRRRPHLYLRCLILCPDKPAKVLVYCVDWLQKAS